MRLAMELAEIRPRGSIAQKQQGSADRNDRGREVRARPKQNRDSSVDDAVIFRRVQ
jgi:hypothetical protein